MKNIKSFIVSLLLTAFALEVNAQRAMTVDDLQAWRRVTQKVISNDGQWAAAVMAPWKGDAEAQIFSADGKQAAAYPLAAEVAFSASSGYAVMKMVPAEKDVEELKLKKTKKEDMPMDALLIRNLLTGEEWTADSVRSYRLAEAADWIAYQTGRKDSILHIASADGKQTLTTTNVSDYGFAKKAAALFYVTTDTLDTLLPGLYVWTAGTGQPVLIKSGDGKFEQMAFDEKGELLAFLYTDKEDKTGTTTALWLAEGAKEAALVLDRASDGMYSGWTISPNGKMRFSKDAARLFFGTAPEPLQKDTTVLDDNRPNVQVWSWDEPVQYTVQSYNVKKDLKKSYSAVLHLSGKRMVQLADTLLPEAALTEDGVGDYALLSDSRPYSLSSMWEGRTRSDYYSVSLTTGERRQLAKADYTRLRISPAGKYAYGYNETDSCWYTFDMASGTRHQLTTPDSFVAWDEEDDHPDYPEAYGAVGWTEDDDRLIILDRYDLWALSPSADSSPVRLTTDGRESQRRYKLVRLDPEKHYIDTGERQLLTAFDEKAKTNSFFSADLGKAGKPKLLAGGEYNYSGALKAKNAEMMLFTKENFQTFPDVYVSDLGMKKPLRLTDGVKQQEEFIWGSVELISWSSFDGVTLEGVIYKPSDFDESRQYPMIVNFYERNAETLHKYHTPEAHRSTIDYMLYLSNGFIIFNPDVRYSVDGFPGEDCYNCVLSGVNAVVSHGYVDSSRIGAQGHSWGGYQTAYLATRTNLFAAIESGAPVVNMFSAYGGIRWGSGLARSFQYEHTQSRLGGTPWDATSRYFENSPLFFMDKVHTPILIMHNDSDGHVPWYQGIEFFVAMKRLGRPVWMLNYVGEPHWPLKNPNKKDFQIRMFQFFCHYLKDEPMPKWMSEGVKAVEQPYELGY